MPPEEARDDAAARERELREHEEAVKEQDPHERSPDAGSGDPLDEDERKPAPPGPESQQPRG